MTCKDCIHYDACRNIFEQLGQKEEIAYMDEQGERGAENECEQFQDKSRFIELPCKVGDKVYIVSEIRGIVSAEVRVFFMNELNHELIRTDYCDIPFCNFNKTAFLTREEAEKKLEELKE